MTRLLRILWVVLLVSLCVGAPTPPALSGPLEHRGAPKPVKWSSFGHQAVNIGLGSVGVLAGILTAEWALHLFHHHQTGAAHRGRLNSERKTQVDHVTNVAQRHNEAMKLLVDIADAHAKKIPAGDFNGKFDTFTVPKEIHEGLEALILSKGNEGVSSLEGYKNLKETLSTLLDFE